MNLRKRRFVVGALSRSLTVLLLLLVAPLSRAESEIGGILNFDVPELQQAPVTVNLLTSRVIGPADLIGSARFLVTTREKQKAEQMPVVVGQYCVVIAATIPVTTPGDDVFLEVTTIGNTPVPLIGVFDTDTVGGTVPANDRSCFKNEPPVAKFTVFPGMNGTVSDSDFLAGEKVLLDASASTDDSKIVNYVFRDQDGNELASGPNPTPQVTLPDGPMTITLTVTDDGTGAPTYYPTKTGQPTATRTAAASATGSYRASSGYGRGYGSYGSYGKSGLSNSTEMTVNVVAPAKLVVSAGQDVDRPDTDLKPGELVELTATVTSQVPEGVLISYQWFLNPGSEDEGTLISEERTFSRRFADGLNRVRLVVTAGDQTATSNVRVNVGPAQTIVAEGGDDRIVPDSDGQPGEVVPLDASASKVPPQVPVTYEWFLNPLDGESPATSLGTGLMIMPRLDDGANRILLRITVQKSGKGGYGGGSYGEGTYGGGSSYGEGHEGGYTRDFTDTFTVTVQPSTPKPNVVAVVTIKPTETVVDTDSVDGEDVTLDGSASQIPPGVQASFEWFRDPSVESNGTSLGKGALIKPRLNNGVTNIRLVVTANGFVFPANATVNVVAPPSVVAVPGQYPPKTDSDGFPGEIFPLNASASRVPANATVTFQWFRDPVGASNGVSLGTGMTINPRLKDGKTIVRLVVTANAVVSLGDTTVEVGTPGQAAQLALLPNLTPNQRRIAIALDDVCGRLIGLTSGLNGPATSQDIMPGTNVAFTDNQADLANKCRGIAINNTVDNQIEAVVDLTPDDFAVARTQALLFANTQYASVLDRLIALRGGARGLSLAGLNIVVDGNTVPLAAMQDFFGKILGGGASSDADAASEPGGLLSDRWGMWVRGNYSTGKRDKSLVSPSFDADQAGIVLGTDYRVSQNAVVGASIAYLDSQIEFNPLREGSLDTTSMALSLYGSLYAAKSFYLDALANIAKADYEARRNISYNQGSSLVPIDLDAKGDTDGITLSAGLSGGYDFLFKGITIAPNAGFFYIDATIDRFAEDGASGFNLLYDEQNFKSFTGNLGFRVNATLNLPWVVLLPGLRVDFIREFNDDVDVFQVRFAADPNGSSAPPVTIQTDNPDSSYWRTSLNLSAQFKFGFAGYVEYQRIDGFSQIGFQDLAFGFRMQRSF